MICNNSTTTDFEEYTNGPSPNPNYPQEIKTVTGYRNLFDKTSSNYFNTYIGSVSHAITDTDSKRYRTIYIPIEGGKKYTITKKYGACLAAGTSIELPYKGLVLNDYVAPSNKLKYTMNTSSGANYLIVYIYSNTDYDDNLPIDDVINTLLITEGNQVLPYVPYGTNWVYTAVSNGTDINYYTIPLNGNEIAGIGDYKDELIVDKNGHCWLNKIFAKYKLDSAKNWYATGANLTDYQCTLPTTDRIYLKQSGIGFSNYFVVKATGNDIHMWPILQGNVDYIRIVNAINKWSTIEDFKTFISNNDVYLLYPTSTPQPIDLNYTVDIRLFKGSNNISNSDDMDMSIKYYSK